MNLNDPDTISKLVQRVQSRATTASRRYIVGIAGIPGSGKSTVAAKIVDAMAGSAVLVPMDGFHLTNARLDALGLRAVKGSPPTFDAAAYIDLLTRARESSERLYFPIYDRALHEPVLRVTRGQEISPTTRIVITEGNYLLLDREPYAALARVLDECWYIDTPIEQSRGWIIQRHIRGGRSPADAEAHYQRNDLPNSRLVIERRRDADLILHRE